MLYCHLLRNILFYANLLAVEAYSVRTGTYKNAYTFQNIANLVSAMYKNKGKGENWNKVVLKCRRKSTDRPRRRCCRIQWLLSFAKSKYVHMAIQICRYMAFSEVP